MDYSRDFTRIELISSCSDLSTVMINMICSWDPSITCCIQSMIHHDQKTCNFSISECSEQLQHVALTPFVVFPLKLQKAPSPPKPMPADMHYTIVLYYIILYYIILYHIILYIILYYIILYYIILYYIILLYIYIYIYIYILCYVYIFIYVLILSQGDWERLGWLMIAPGSTRDSSIHSLRRHGAEGWQLQTRQSKRWKLSFSEKQQNQINIIYFKQNKT